MNNIDDIPKDKISEILSETLKNFLLSEQGQELFYKKDSPYGYRNKQPSDFLENVIANADIKESISPIVNTVIEEFSKNYEVLIKQCIFDYLSSMFFGEFNKYKLNSVYDKLILQDNH